MRQIALPDGRSVDLRYFSEWRPYLWSAPVARAMAFLGDVAGRRVLEIGGRSGRMSALFALLGAEVTMVESGRLAAAKAEAEKWGVVDRIRLLSTDGRPDQMPDETFDIVFTKSVLWSIADLRPMLAEIDRRLSAQGKVAFLENVRGGPFMWWLRTRVIHRRDISSTSFYHGIAEDQLDFFRQQFDDVRIRRHLWTVYEITGRKRLPP